MGFFDTKVSSVIPWVIGLAVVFGFLGSLVALACGADPQHLAVPGLCCTALGGFVGFLIGSVQQASK